MSGALSTEAASALDKAVKLLALARNNDNEHQAAAALEACQRLLEKHNLDMALVERKSGGGSGSKREDQKTGGGLYKWQRSLWEEIAKLNFCMYWSIPGKSRGEKYENRVLGRPENVMMTKMMAEYLQGAIERITREWAKERGCNIFARDAIAYREGMADRICSRLRDKRYEAEAAERRKADEAAREARASGSGTPGTALVIADIQSAEADLNNDYLNGWEPGTTAAKRAEQNAKYEAYRAQAKKDAAERQAAMEEADRLLRENNPDEWLRQKEAALKAAEEERIRLAKADAKWERDYYRREARRAKRPLSTNRAKGPRSHTYYAGQQAGDSVGLDAQIGNSNAGKLK